MRSHRLRPRAAEAARRRACGVHREIAVRIAEPGARTRERARRCSGGYGLARSALLVPGNAYAVGGAWTGPLAASGPRAAIGARQPTVPERHCDVHQQRGRDLGHHLQQHLDQHDRVRRRGAGLFVHRAKRGDLHDRHNSNFVVRIGLQRQQRRDAGHRRHRLRRDRLARERDFGRWHRADWNVRR